VIHRLVGVNPAFAWLAQPHEKTFEFQRTKAGERLSKADLKQLVQKDYLYGDLKIVNRDPDPGSRLAGTEVLSLLYLCLLERFFNVQTVQGERRSCACLESEVGTPGLYKQRSTFRIRNGLLHPRHRNPHIGPDAHRFGQVLAWLRLPNCDRTTCDFTTLVQTRVFRYIDPDDVWSLLRDRVPGPLLVDVCVQCGA
jgi:hypothetical protein